MTTIHPHAELAAEAAEAAGDQGKFWNMHDMLFANQEQLDPPSLSSYAAALALDVDQFNNTVFGQIHLSKIREDFMSGVRSGVNGTPSFFINGARHYLAGRAGDAANAILAAVGYNFRRLIAWLVALLCLLRLACLRGETLSTSSTLRLQTT